MAQLPLGTVETKEFIGTMQTWCEKCDRVTVHLEWEDNRLECEDCALFDAGLFQAAALDNFPAVPRSAVTFAPRPKSLVNWKQVLNQWPGGVLVAILALWVLSLAAGIDALIRTWAVK